MLQFNFFYCRGTSGIDIDLRRVDIDQCPQNYTTGVKQPMNIFAGTDKCKHRTTKVSFDQVHFAWNLCALVNLSSKHKKKSKENWKFHLHGCMIFTGVWLRMKTLWSAKLHLTHELRAQSSFLWISRQNFARKLGSIFHSTQNGWFHPVNAIHHHSGGGNFSYSAPFSRNTN